MKRLTTEQRAQYEREGATHPIRVFSEQRAAQLLATLEAGEAQHGPEFRTLLRTKAHLTLKWVDELVRSPEILDPVEDLIGPNILLYNMSVFIKDAQDPNWVGWHQDSTYYPLEPQVLVNAWLALTDSVADNGNVRYAPGSHTIGQIRHERGLKGTLLSQGQSIQGMEFDKVNDIFLQPGEMSMHHVRVIHYSEPNRSSRRRIGMSFSYIPTSVKNSSSIRHTAMLVRGVDHFLHFDPEPRVRFDFDPEVQEFKKDAVQRFRAANQEQAQLHEQVFADTK